MPKCNNEGWAINKILILSVFAVLGCFLSFYIHDARADDQIISDGPSCVSIGGTWNFPTCTVTSLTIPLGTTLRISGVTLDNTGTLTNDGTINNGIISISTGSILNEAGATLSNSGAINNLSGSGIEDKSFGTIINSGTINNDFGTIGTDAGSAITNSGSITNSDTISNSGDIFNTGTITNNHVIFNDGQITDKCGGTYSGNPPTGHAVQEVCNTISIDSVSSTIPRWGVDPVSITGSITGSGAGDTVTINWGDGTTTTSIAITGSTWGPVPHTYGSAALSTNPNHVVATLVDGSNNVLATSAADSISVKRHKTSLSLTSVPNQPWGRPVSFTTTLTDVDTGTTISGRIISFNGTGVIGVANKITNGAGIATGTGTAPGTIATGWTYQSHFAGNQLYIKSNSLIKKYNTIKHSTSITISLKPSSVIQGGTFAVNGTLRDATTGTILGSKIISFVTTSPLAISNTATNTAGAYTKNAIAPANSGAYNIQSKFAGNLLYFGSFSPVNVLTVS